MERNQGTPAAKYCGCGGGSGQGKENLVMWYPAKIVNNRLQNLSNKKMTKAQAIKTATEMLAQ